MNRGEESRRCRTNGRRQRRSEHYQRLVVAVIARVMFAGLLGVMFGVYMMSVRHVRVMTRFVMVATLVMIGRRLMMLGGVLVMFRGFAVMLDSFV
jgi:hypothetical protein